MKNPLQERILKLSEQQARNVMKPVKGSIVEYTNEYNIAMVEVDNPNGAGKILLPRVPVQVLGGMHAPGPFKGDEVWVEFTGGLQSLPKIVAFADREYKHNTREKKMKHKKKGAYIPDRLSGRKK